MSDKMKTANIEYGRPTVDEALLKLSFEITTAKRQGAVALKVIHGYGSSGAGGKIKTAVQKNLSDKKRAGMIKAFLPGEKWSIFDQEARDMLNRCSFLGNESDLNRTNPGITIVLL